MFTINELSVLRHSLENAEKYDVMYDSIKDSMGGTLPTQEFNRVKDILSHRLNELLHERRM